MANEICQITQLPIIHENENFKGDGICNIVKLGNLQFPVNLTPSTHKYLLGQDHHRHIATGLILNGFLHDNVILSMEISLTDISKGEIPRQRKNLQEWFSENYFPKTDLEKVDFSLERVQRLIGKMGASIEFDGKDSWYKMFFCQDKGEFNFILRTLQTKGFIEILDKPIGPDGLPSKTGKIFPQKVNLTYEGISYLNKKQKEVQKDLCFVAMSFGADETQIFTEALKPAIKAAGYQAKRVDDTDHHIDKEQTINDSILALAKKANFLVCDYTGNKRGVYFEHGYAWGLGKKVIMTVKESEMNDLHFDVSHYPFIVWKDYEDLRIRLQAKIESWIGRFENN